MVIRPPENSLLRVLLGRWGQTGFASSCLHQTQRCSGRVGGGGGEAAPAPVAVVVVGGEHARRGLGVSERRGQRAHRPPTSVVSPPGALRRPGMLRPRPRGDARCPAGSRRAHAGSERRRPGSPLVLPPPRPPPPARPQLGQAARREGGGLVVEGGENPPLSPSRRLAREGAGWNPPDGGQVGNPGEPGEPGRRSPSSPRVWGCVGEGTEGGNGTRTIARRPGLSETHRQPWGEAGGGWVGEKM